MKLKKLLSGISALAVAASAFAGLAVTADAAKTTVRNLYTQDFENATLSDLTYTLADNTTARLQTNTAGNSTTFFNYYLNNAGGNRESTLTLPSEYGAGLPTKFSLLVRVMGSNQNENVFELRDSSGIALFNMTSTSYLNNTTINGETVTLTTAKLGNDNKLGVSDYATSGWLKFEGTVDFGATTKTVTLTVTDTTNSNTVVYSDSYTTTATNIKTVYGSLGRSNGAFAYDDIIIDEYADDITAVSSVEITGADSMTFGADPDTAASNQYQVVISGEDGSVINESNISPKVSDFNVKWDIDGFKTANDTEGQYCDSYGAFATNNAAQVGTSFELRNVPMNFYGKMTATITYNGSTYTAEKYVVALGNKSMANGQILPEAGYPSDLDAYPDSLVEYSTKKDTYGTAFDTIVGGWVMSGSDSGGAAVIKSENGNKFIRINSANSSKSHVFTNSISTPATQAIFEQDVRFNSNGGVITLTSKYPFWGNGYTNPVTVSYNNSALTLNSTPITDNNDAKASVSTGIWYKLVLSIDKTTKTAFVKLYDANGVFVGGADNVAWTEDSSPTFYSIGMGNSNIGTIDFDNYSAYYPTADTSTFTLTASQDTLSIPNGDTADLAAALKTTEGYELTGKAAWTVLEDDMKEGVIVTPDETDSHKAKVTLASGAEAGTATVQVNIGGYTKTVELNITSSAESVKFTKSSASVSIPLNDTPITAEYAAAVVDGSGNEVSGRTVTFAVYDKNNTSAYTLPTGISFANGILTVTKAAPAVTFTIRATGKNSNDEDISKSVKVTVHGLSFDFGTGDDAALAEGYTAVSADTSYTSAHGYGIANGSPTAGGTASTSDAASDYLDGAMTFKADVEKGKNYTVEITYQGTLTTGYVNNDLAGYTLGTQDSLAAASYTVPAPVDTIDLAVSGDDAKIAAITITKNADKAANTKPDIHHIGDSTAANNGSWAYSLAASKAKYPDLFDIATFYNNGAGGRNLCTYYTQGKLASVLRSIEPGDIVMFGNNGTNGMGSSFEADVNYYLDAAEAMGAKIIINSYTPHGAVGSYSNTYNSSTHTFNSYRQDSYDVIVRKVAEERKANDSNYLGFVEIGKNADAAFNAYVADYAANGYASADAAAQAIIACFSDHNHYSNGSTARDLMLNGYGEVKGIVAQLVDILNAAAPKTFDDIIKEDTEGNTVTIANDINGNDFSEPAKATVADGVTADVKAEIKNATIESSGTFTVIKGDSVITNASTVQFDSKGKINPGDGSIISTPNASDNNKTDNGYFITKNASGDTIKIKVDNKTVDVKIGNTIQGDVLFCVFVTGIPEGKTVQVLAD